jgi:peroxiredoxin
MRFIFGFAGAALAATLFAQAPPPKTQLKVGDVAPDFTVRTTANTTFHLADYRGKKTVVVAFFPAAFTGG